MRKSALQVVLFVGILITSVLSGPLTWAHEAPRRIEITAKRFAFDPGEITLKKGEPVVLVIRSADVAHGLRIREMNVDVKVSAGGTAEVQLTPERTGNFTGHCAVFCGAGHNSMTLKLHVVN